MLRDKLVSFPDSQLSLSSPASVFLLAVTVPVCLYQHLETPLFFFPHTQASIVMSLFIVICINPRQTRANFWPLNLFFFPALSPFLHSSVHLHL